MSSLREQELSILHYFSGLLGKIFDFEELLEMLVTALTKHFTCRRISIILLDEEGSPVVKMAKGFSNDDALVKNLKLDSIGPISKEIIRKKKPILFKTKKDWLDAKLKINSNYKTFAFLSVPILNNNEVKGIINIAEPEKKRTFSNEDMRMLEIIATQIGFSLETISLHKAIVRQEVYKKELEIGRKLQLSLLPASHPKNDRLDLSLCSFPAMLVGGDYYDFLNLDDNRVAIAIGDISGKGVSASIIMASLRTLVRAHLPRMCNNLAKTVQDINEALYQDLGSSHYYSTLILGIFDFSKMTFTFINAGHNYPILYREATGETIELQGSSTTFLGSFPELKPEEEILDIHPGDVLLFFTDGLIENKNAERIPYDEEQIKNLLKKHSSGNRAVQIKEMIHNDFRKHLKGNPLSDDYTIIIAKIL
ncbi:MAG: SpoIIE family protein phosphatase [Candidatus Wallbacteria bacterium]|nr:SpoIIE family protein phosphatase [Candidatus Wallbacteria bacterium]